MGDPNVGRPTGPRKGPIESCRVHRPRPGRGRSQLAQAPWPRGARLGTRQHLSASDTGAAGLASSLPASSGTGPSGPAGIARGKASAGWLARAAEGEAKAPDTWFLKLRESDPATTTPGNKANALIHRYSPPTSCAERPVMHGHDRRECAPDYRLIRRDCAREPGAGLTQKVTLSLGGHGLPADAAREVLAERVAGGALITVLCAWLGRHAARARAMVPRLASTAAAEPVPIAAIAVARAAAPDRPCRAGGMFSGRDRSCRRRGSWLDPRGRGWHDRRGERGVAGAAGSSR